MVKKRGVCPTCGRTLAVRVDGTMTGHNTKATYSEICPATLGRYRPAALKKCEVESCQTAAKYRLTIQESTHMDLCEPHSKTARSRLGVPSHTTLLKWIEDPTA